MASVQDTLELVLRVAEVGTVLAAFRMITEVVESAVTQFAELDASLIRAQFMMSQFGQSLPAGELTEFTRQLSLSTGASQQAVAGLEAYLARFASSGAEIERATRVIVETSQATGLSLERVGHMMEQLRAGRGRQVWQELGIQVKGFEGQIYSTDQALDILERHFHGFSQVFGSTFLGQLRLAAAAVEDLVIQFGRLFSPIFMAVVELFTVTVRILAETLKGIADALGIATPGLEGAAASATGIAGASRGGQMEEYMQQVAFNTGPQGALVHALGQGGGSFAATPGGAGGIRDFNTMFRTSRNLGTVRT